MFSNPTFWVGVAFVLFFAILFYFGVPKNLMSSLDTRSKRIADELAEARRLREDAQRLLKEYESKRQAAEQEAAEIVSNARDEAERLAQSEATIAARKTEAMSNVRRIALETATAIVERLTGRAPAPQVVANLTPDCRPRSSRRRFCRRCRARWRCSCHH